MTDYQLATVDHGQVNWAAATPITIPRLTPRQREILAYLHGYIAVHGYPPTLEEVRAALGLASPSTVSWHLDKLAAKDLVQRDGRIIRGVRVAHEPWGHAREELYPLPGGVP